MQTYTITLTSTEDLALKYAAVSVQTWIDNAVHERARLAVDEIVQIAVQKCLENQIQIPSTRELIVSLAFEKAWVKTAFDRELTTPL
jgi:hypothetical protein